MDELPSLPRESRLSKAHAIFWQGCCGLFLGGLIGLPASQLTIGMLLARHFDSGQHAKLAMLWMAVCLMGGFLLGACFQPRWLNDRFRCVCWGAVCGLTVLTIATRLPLLLLPASRTWGVYLPVVSARLNLEEAGFVSAPGALLLGGFLGWFFHWHRQLTNAKKSPLLSESADNGKIIDG